MQSSHLGLSNVRKILLDFTTIYVLFNIELTTPSVFILKKGVLSKRKKKKSFICVYTPAYISQILFHIFMKTCSLKGCMNVSQYGSTL